MTAMALGRKVCLCAVAAFLSGCTFLVTGESQLTTDANPVVETDSVADIDSDTDIGSLTESNAVIEIKFVESAPKDRFVMTNVGACALDELMIEFDLSQSAGKLIFDTTAAGAGVEVFQPFEVEAGDIVQVNAEGVDDGDTKLSLRIASLGPGNVASFTIDVDDTLPIGELGQIRVSDSEINGAIVNITAGESETISTRFNDESTAQANLPTCS